MALAAATFAPNPRRRTLLALAHIAPKQLGMDDDSYRAVLLRATGRMSAKDCTVPELEALAAEFRRLGFSAMAKKRSGPARADHAVARKARVMWISLSLLCAIDIEPDKAIKGDAALEAFAKRQLGCDRLVWANQNHGDKLIEALKAMAARHGWDQSQSLYEGRKMSKDQYVHALKVRLCDAILAKLKRAGLAAAGWMLEDAAFRLTGTKPVGIHFTAQEYERLAGALGRHLRAHGGRAAFMEISA